MSIAAREASTVDQSFKKAIAFPCTPAEQLIEPATPDTPPPNVTTDVEPLPQPALSQQLVDSEAAYSKTMDLFIATLEQHPWFAKSQEKLAGFASLSDADRKCVLEEFCLGQYKDSNFRALVRTMDASHRSQLCLTL